MTIFSILILLIIIAISYYLMPGLKNRLILFTVLIVITPVGYILKGSFESFTFNEENNIIIEDIIISKEKIDELDPNRLILYLENKLNKNPKDLKGWLILARTCSLSGYLQKADLYFKKGLEFFEAHKAADVLHRKACEKLLDGLSKKEQKKAEKAALSTAKYLWNFLSGMVDKHSLKLAA